MNVEGARSIYLARIGDTVDIFPAQATSPVRIEFFGDVHGVELARGTQDYLAARESIGRTKPVTLMDMGTIAGKVLRARCRR